MDPAFTLLPATTEAQHAEVAALFEELRRWDMVQVRAHGIDVALADAFYYADDAAAIPGPYAPPQGALLLAMAGTATAGCGAFGPLESGVCELRRLWVREAWRGRRLGEQLVCALMQRAKAAGYTHMRLETVRFMQSAIRLYRSLGFVERPAYYEIPTAFHAITLFMERPL
jgi:ribosomal protein S18 acetylase RimI-like enzyme